MRRATLNDTKKLCEQRARRERDAGIARDVAGLLRNAKQGERRNSGAAAALERALPARLLEHAWIESTTAVQLVLGVESASAAYEVDRAMRDGGLQVLRTELRLPTLRVRTRVGQLPGS